MRFANSRRSLVVGATSLGLTFWNKRLFAGAKPLSDQRGPGTNVSSVIPSEVQFTGIRVSFQSNLRFETVLAKLYAELGSKPVDLKGIDAATKTWEDYEEKVRAFAGPAGFMLFATLDYGSWIAKVGIERRELRIIFGNPLIAITMIRHDLTAALFVPVELLVTAGKNPDTCTLTYLMPSSLMAIDRSQPELLLAAKDLDAKMAHLISSISV